jgi:hypothetical protein
VKTILFDINVDSFKKIEVNNDFIITDIILPKNEKDFAKMRENAERKGKVVRTLKIDDKVEKKEVEFVA